MIDIQSMRNMLDYAKREGKDGLLFRTCDIEALTEDIEALNKEADWLALKQANCPSEFRARGCQSDNINDTICKWCWREAAKKAVQNGNYT